MDSVHYTDLTRKELTEHKTKEPGRKDNIKLVVEDLRRVKQMRY